MTNTITESELLHWRKNMRPHWNFERWYEAETFLRPISVELVETFARRQIMLDAKNSGLTLSDIGAKFDLSKGRVWQLIRLAERHREKRIPDEVCETLRRLKYHDRSVSPDEMCRKNAKLFTDLRILSTAKRMYGVKTTVDCDKILRYVRERIGQFDPATVIMPTPPELDEIAAKKFIRELSRMYKHLTARELPGEFGPVYMTTDEEFRFFGVSDQVIQAIRRSWGERDKRFSLEYRVAVAPGIVFWRPLVTLPC